MCLPRCMIHVLIPIVSVYKSEYGRRVFYECYRSDGALQAHEAALKIGTSAVLLLRR